MAGRKQKPTKLKLLEGDRHKERINYDEPEVDVVIPKCPIHLSELARLEWNRLTRELERLGMIAEIDMTALATYCQLYGRWIELENDIGEHGLTDIDVRFDKKGNVVSKKRVMNPEVAEARQTIHQLRLFISEFGMSPSARTKMFQGVKGKKKDPMEELLKNAI